MHVAPERCVQPLLTRRIDGCQLAHQVPQQGPQSRHVSDQSLQVGEEAGECQLDLPLADSWRGGELQVENEEAGVEFGGDLAGGEGG